MNNKYSVYKHTSPSGKVYIGITSTSLNDRWRNGKGYNGQVAFKNAIDKYGWENIKHEVLLEGLSKEDAFEKERELISLYDSTNPKHGYNVSVGGGMGCIGYRHTDEAKERIREKMKKRVFTHEHRKRISESRKGCVISEEQRRQISDTLKGRYYGHSNKPIVQIDKETNEIIKIWDSAAKAARSLNTYPQNIGKVCMGKLQTCCGYKWSYYEGESG